MYSASEIGAATMWRSRLSRASPQAANGLMLSQNALGEYYLPLSLY